jgi:cytochrome b561
MPSARPAERYDSVQIALHWLTAAFIVAAIGLIWTVNSLPKGDLRTTLFFLHRSCGVTILTLTVLRLAWRLGHHVPPPPAALPVWQQLAAVATHWLLYGLLLVMPVTGYLSSALRGHSVSVFFLFDLPALGDDTPFAEAAGAIHETLQWAVYGLILLHAAAALRHHLVLRDSVLRRMLPAGRAPAA